MKLHVQAPLLKVLANPRPHSRRMKTKSRLGHLKHLLALKTVAHFRFHLDTRITSGMGQLLSVTSHLQSRFFAELNSSGKVPRRTYVLLKSSCISFILCRGVNDVIVLLCVSKVVHLITRCYVAQLRFTVVASAALFCCI